MEFPAEPPGHQRPLVAPASPTPAVRAFDKWLLPYLLRRRPAAAGPTHVLIAICDHFEPLHDTDKAGALRRVRHWAEEYPRMIAAFRDADGQPPKHTFFYPVEQYDPALLEPLAALCRATGSEVEIHLHHERDTPGGFREALERGKEALRRHGLLCRDAAGQTRFGFIHGNWALNNTHPHGRGCGVDREIRILREAGCYADFTMPSAPSPTQARVVNRITYLADLPRHQAYAASIESTRTTGPSLREDPGRLLAIPGPLALNWKRRKWGLLPRLENGDLTGANPPTALRLRLAVRQRISVRGNGQWVFVKWHTHGGIESNSGTLLGEPMRRFHRDIARRDEMQIHYVTAREMANLVHAAEDGMSGDPAPYRDSLFRCGPGVAAGSEAAGPPASASISGPTM